MIKSGYSFRVAVGHLEDVASRVKEIGWTVGPIADCNSTFSFNRWVKACGPDVRPVFGVQLNVAVDPFGKRPSFDWWTFLAIDKLRPLHDLIELATSQSGPALSYKQALAAEGVIKISGERVLLEHVTESDNYYFGITPAVPKGLLSVAIQRGLPLIAHQCNSYPRTEDREFYRVTLGGRRASTQTYPQHILSDEEWVGTCSAPMPVLMQALQTKGKVLDGCRAVLRQATLLKPQVEKTLHQLCLEGAERLGCDLSRQVYAERLDKELGLIAEKQFEDYFFIIADMVNYAKQHMIVGPARGSSCGSLVCYLLGITTIDPIPFNLIFERFIDTTRADLPDIDLDFSDARRQLVFDYAEEKYGKDRVARLGTVGTFHPRSAMKQAGIELRVPQWRIEKVLEQVIVRSGGDSRALQTLEDTLNDTEAGRTMLKDFPELMIAAKMEGHPSVASQHAAGIVLTQTPIKDYVAIDARTGAAMCDKKDAEDLNLLKIDALGLTQLSIFERTLELIGKPTKNGWLETLPIDDKAAFAVLNKHQFAGIFQFAGSALQSLSKQVNISSIEDIIAITALARPGPLASGGATAWVKRKIGLQPIQYPHKVFEPYLKDDMGVVIFQETVMRIGREIGDLNWDDVTSLRKAMSRSLGKEYFDRWGDKWKEGAAKRGVPEEIRNNVWDELCAYGSWSFNRSHAVAYGMVSYYCCYLKAHHPLEFAAATLDAESDPSRQLLLLRELKDEGIDYLPVDPDNSIDKWLPVKKDGRSVLVGPLTSIKGIGPVTVKKILEARQSGGPLPPSLLAKLNGCKTPIDSLYPISDAVKNIDLEALKIVSDPVPVRAVQCGQKGQRVMIFAVLKRIVPASENEERFVAKRGYRIEDRPTAYLNLFVADDTDEIYVKIESSDFERMGRIIQEEGKVGKSLYAFKGEVPPRFRMIKVEAVRKLGELS